MFMFTVIVTISSVYCGLTCGNASNALVTASGPCKDPLSVGCSYNLPAI